MSEQDEVTRLVQDYQEASQNPRTKENDQWMGLLLLRLLEMGYNLEQGEDGTYYPVKFAEPTNFDIKVDGYFHDEAIRESRRRYGIE